MNVFLAVPCYGGGISLATKDAILKAVVGSYRDGFNIIHSDAQKSLLANCFNTLWCEALNLIEAGQSLDWFVMLHSDLGSADPDWLQHLVGAAEANGLDAAAAVAAIKDGTGDTSTALFKDGQIERLSARGLKSLPPVLTNGYAKATLGGTLLINSGMLALRLNRDWNTEFCFSIDDRIERGPDGRWYAKVLSEDWRMSFWMDHKGIPYGAVQSVPTRHFGGAEWSCDFTDSAIPGWMAKEDLDYLSSQAAKMTSVVEVGCYKGRSTRALLEACPGPVFAVDNWRGKVRGSDHEDATAGDQAFLEFKANVGQYPNLTIIRENSDYAAELLDGMGPFDMTFIDGDHSYAAVQSDIANYLPLTGKLMCGHDIDEPAVLRAVVEAFGDRWKRVSGKLWAVDLEET